MKGYYCIYECSKNQWLYEGIQWVNDRDFYPHTIGTKHAIQINQSYNYNPKFTTSRSDRYSIYTRINRRY